MEAISRYAIHRLTYPIINFISTHYNKIQKILTIRRRLFKNHLFFNSANLLVKASKASLSIFWFAVVKLLVTGITGILVVGGGKGAFKFGLGKLLWIITVWGESNGSTEGLSGKGVNAAGWIFVFVGVADRDDGSNVVGIVVF